MANALQTANPLSPVASAGFKTSNNNILIPDYVANEHTSAILTSTNGTTPLTLLTGAPFYYVGRMIIKVDPNCTVSGGALQTITIADSSSGQLLQYRVWIPNTFTSPTSPVAGIETQTTNYFFDSKVATSTLTVTLGTALTSGSIRVAINYGFTAIQGQ